MTRQILVSAAPDVPTEPREGAELGRWLTHDLRPKGALEGRLAAPSVPPESRRSEPAASDFGRWLASDLTPRRSAAPPDSLAPQLLPARVDSVLPAPPDSVRVVPIAIVPVGGTELSVVPPALVTPPISRATRPLPALTTAALVPAALVPAALAPAALAPVARVPADEASSLVPSRDLEDEDLLVLPSRRGALAKLSPRARRRSFAVAGALLLAVGLLSMRGRAPSDAAVTASAAEPFGVLAALPPPPPDDVPLPPQPEPPPSTEARLGARAASDEAPGDVDPEDPRWRLGGPSVKRFADVASPTLSRLAREQLEQARKRDEELRRAAKRAKAER